CARDYGSSYVDYFDYW
nr:immunoglobulin heavy chain junction region [Mus musculus]NSM04410.1 immunoglobulin heavy chain junction region [Mus musculus]NSM05113.1 immunoglobulin heavy chain junction region [Mus musculus]NSM05195.1 immunoglobulin heavy chain junction region [Mus musculus]NSM05835.1 immunoglobulin heavy chain junction region [Mus musculus]